MRSSMIAGGFAAFLVLGTALTPATAAPPPVKPRLIVAISVDQ
jgi:hypothetical protein